MYRVYARRGVRVELHEYVIKAEVLTQGARPSRLCSSSERPFISLVSALGVRTYEESLGKKVRSISRRCQHNPADVVKRPFLKTNCRSRVAGWTQQSFVVEFISGKEDCNCEIAIWREKIRWSLSSRGGPFLVHLTKNIISRCNETCGGVVAGGRQGS